jgi:hypothetical protein
MTDAADLLAAGLCSARCLLAMETPPGWAGCGCVCNGTWHAALIDADVQPIAEIRDAHGTTVGTRPALRRAS